MRIRVCAVLAVVLWCSCKPKPPDPAEVAEYDRPFVPALAQIIANPKAQKPKTTKEDKVGGAVYTFDAMPAIAVANVTLTTAKARPGATVAAPTKLSFDSVGVKLTLRAFAKETTSALVYSTTMDMAEGWLDVREGPLKGSIVHLDASGMSAQIYSPSFLLSAASSDAEVPMQEWACSSGKGGVVSISPSTFTGQCKDLVRSKLLLPESADFHWLGIDHEVSTTRDCGHFWHSDVKSKNAFGVEITHSFSCTYDAKKNVVEMHL